MSHSASLFILSTRLRVTIPVQHPHRPSTTGRWRCPSAMCQTAPQAPDETRAGRPESRAARSHTSASGADATRAVPAQSGSPLLSRLSPTGPGGFDGTRATACARAVLRPHCFLPLCGGRDKRMWTMVTVRSLLHLIFFSRFFFFFTTTKKKYIEREKRAHKTRIFLDGSFL